MKTRLLPPVHSRFQPHSGKLLLRCTGKPPRSLRKIIANEILSTPWEQAIARLKPEDLGGIDINSQTKLDILHWFVTETEAAQKVCQDKQWKYTTRNGEERLVRDSVNTLLVNVQKYTAIGDLVVQPLPSVVSLAWIQTSFDGKLLTSLLLRLKCTYRYRLRSRIWKIQRLRWRAWKT